MPTRGIEQFRGLQPSRPNIAPTHRPTRWQLDQTARKYSAVKGLCHALLIIRQSNEIDYFPGVTSTAAYVSGTAASGDSTRKVKLCCKYSSTEVLV